MVAIQVSEERGVRYLHFGSPWIQGAMRIARPWALELEYTRELMLPLLLRGERWPRRVLQVGLGAASITRFLHRHVPRSRLTVIEIAPEVVAAARQFFRLPEDPERIEIRIADAHEAIGRGRARYDLVVVDGFDAEGRAGPLDSAPFYARCHERLAPDGILAVNLLTRRKSAAASLERLRRVFGERVLELPPSEAGNVVALAAVGAPIEEPFDALFARADALRGATELNLKPTLARLTGMRQGRGLSL